MISREICLNSVRRFSEKIIKLGYEDGMIDRMLRHGLRAIFRILLRLLTRLKVEGLDNIPERGGYILASNHLGLIDPVVVFSLLERDDATALAAKKHQKNPFFRMLINAVHGIWLNREEADTHALRAARDHLKAGGILGIAPEGTRSPTGALMPPKFGIAYMAEMAGVPIIPVGIWGTENAIKEAFSLQSPRIRVRIGKPFRLPPIDRKKRDGDLRRNTDLVMGHIAGLLPPEYRGVYADHPLAQYGQS
jgi:1-acyl-sn-glycerol-3-phosphate acyltransferase